MRLWWGAGLFSLTFINCTQSSPVIHTLRPVFSPAHFSFVMTLMSVCVSFLVASSVHVFAEHLPWAGHCLTYWDGSWLCMLALCSVLIAQLSYGFNLCHNNSSLPFVLVLRLKTGSICSFYLQCRFRFGRCILSFLVIFPYCIYLPCYFCLRLSQILLIPCLISHT